jgi:chemotaxis protein MotB
MDTSPPSQQTRSSPLPWLLLLLVMGAAGALIYYGLNALKQAHDASDRAVAARDDALKLIKTLEDAQGGLQAKLAQAQTDLNDAAAKTQALQSNLNETEAQLKALKATTTSLEEKLKAEIAHGDIKLSQSGDRIQVDLVDKILFDSGDASLSQRGQDVLNKVAAVLKTIEDKQIQVSGHTDDSPIKNEDLKKQFPTNWELSVARAVNVVRFLTETGGVPAKHVLAAGYGQWHPIAANANPKGRAANRRIEILLTPLLEPAKVVAKKK